MGIANLVGGATLLILGLVMRVFKASSLIAGYNTAPEEEKRKYDEEALTRFVGNFLLLLSVILLAGWGLTFANIPVGYVVAVSWAVFVVVVIAGLVYMNTGGRFKKRS